MMERSTEAGMAHIKGLHHNAYRCRDSEETRAWYEDFLGLKLVSAFPIDEGRALHTFFQMDDGSCLAFFEVPGKPFDFKRQDSLDLHIALSVDNDVFERMLQKGRARAIEVRGPVDHGFLPLDLFPRPERLHRRADRRYRRSPGDHGPSAVEAARGAHSLAGREARLIRRRCPGASGEPRPLRGMKSLPAARAERPLSDQLADLYRSAGADGDTRGKVACRASARRC